MSSDSIRLHPEHGLNPTMPVCMYCGQDTGEIALLGASYKGKAPSRMMISDQPCAACAAKVRNEGYVLFVGHCGHNGLIKREALRSIVGDEFMTKVKDIVGFEKCPQCMGMMKGEQL